MLRVTMHAGPPAQATRFNRTDWLDIGYESLKPNADYKIALFRQGIGASEPVFLRGYPRWSASLWDLVARAIAVALWPEPTGRAEVVPDCQSVGKKCAFADQTTALITHYPESGTDVRQVGCMLINHDARKRGTYIATVDEDTQPRRSIAPFPFAPPILRPAELVMRCSLWMLAGTLDSLPARPALALPHKDIEDGKAYIRLSRLEEPARSGLVRWLRRKNRELEIVPQAPGGRVPADWFVQFLEQAI